MPLPQPQRRPTGSVERVHAGQLAVNRRTPTRPRPATKPVSTRAKTERRSQQLDAALVLHRTITRLLPGANPQQRKYLIRASRSTSKAITILFDQILGR
jgi:hypothetical protein